MVDLYLVPSPFMIVLQQPQGEALETDVLRYVVSSIVSIHVAQAT